MSFVSLKRRVARIAVVAGVSAVAVATVAGLAFADGEYAVGYEQSAGTHYTAAAETKTEFALSIPGSGCSANYVPPVVYEPLWLSFAANDWLEIGTAYSCGNVRYRYTYECLNGSCAYGTTYPLVNGAVDLRFRIIWTGSTFAMQAGSATLATSVHQSKKGIYAHTGTENHAGNVTIRRQDFKSLAYSLDFSSASTGWAGRDTQTINAPACGGWASDIQWYSGRNSTC